MITRTWRLDHYQSISVDNKDLIHFNHYSHIGGRRHTFTISIKQFLNLHDIILNWRSYGDIDNLPIGNRVWLSRRWMVKRLYHSQTRSSFAFTRESWLKYKKKIHYAVHHFLRDGRQLQNREYHAINETRKLNQSRRSPQRLSQVQIPTRSSTDGNHTAKQRSKCSSLSKWNDSTPRCNFEFRRAVDEVRAGKDSATIVESGEDSDNSELEDVEYCSVD